MSWTFVGRQSAPAGAGGILPRSTTGVDFDPSLAPTPAADPSNCSFYPRVDAYVYPPLGWRGSALTLGALAGASTGAGHCPSATSDFYGWQHYSLGDAVTA